MIVGELVFECTVVLMFLSNIKSHVRSNVKSHVRFHIRRI